MRSCFYLVMSYVVFRELLQSEKVLLACSLGIH